LSTANCQLPGYYFIRKRRIGSWRKSRLTEAERDFFISSLSGVRTKLDLPPKDQVRWLKKSPRSVSL